MNKHEIVTEALRLPEYQRKQIAMALLASTLTDIAYNDALEMMAVVDGPISSEGQGES